MRRFREAQGQGSGVVIDEDGFIVTNRHVIDGSARIEIALSDGRRRAAKVVGYDELTDIAILKAKVDAGATRAITQFAFDDDLFPRLRDRARKAGIDVPIVPGLMPTTNFKGVARMAARCGASVPQWLSKLYDGLDNDPESRKLVASAVLVEQVRLLKTEGFDQFHFYTLNQAELTFAVCNILGIKPLAKAAAA